MFAPVNKKIPSKTLVFPELFFPTSKFTRASFSSLRCFRLRKFSTSKDSINIAEPLPG